MLMMGRYMEVYGWIRWIQYDGDGDGDGFRHENGDGGARDGAKLFKYASLLINLLALVKLCVLIYCTNILFDLFFLYCSRPVPGVLLLSVS